MKEPWAHMNAATGDDELGFAYRLSAATGVLLLVASLCGLILGSRGIYDPMEPSGRSVADGWLRDRHGRRSAPYHALPPRDWTRTARRGVGLDASISAGSRTRTCYVRFHTNYRMPNGT
jgi:hypothetical protein